MRHVSDHWIQRADFGTKSFGEAAQSRILELLKEHPWEDEVRFLDELEAKGEDCCPPGLGLNATNADILHFCSVGPGEWIVHVHHREKYRILGLVPSWRDKLDTFQGVSTRQAQHMVVQFFSGDRVRPDE